MPRRTTLILILVSTIACALAFANWRTSTSSQDLQMKLLSLKPVERDLIPHTRKLLPPIDVTLGASESTEIDTPFELTAKITTEIDLTKIQYEWILPKGVVLASSQSPIRNTIYNNENKREFEIRTEFINHKAYNQKIHIRIVGFSGQTKYTKTAQFNTLDQELIDARKRQTAENQKQYLLDHPELLRKSE